MTDARVCVSETCLPCPCEGGGLRQPADRPGRAVEADGREQDACGAHAGVQSGLLQLLVRHDFSGKVLVVMLAGDQITGRSSPTRQQAILAPLAFGPGLP